MTRETLHTLLSTAEMAMADRLAVGPEQTSFDLMLRAGRAVAQTAERRAMGRPIAVLCGPGNNGGDGYVAAALLRDWGHRVTVFGLVASERLSGDAARAAAMWGGEVTSFAGLAASLAPESIVTDAVFGAGLTRPVDGLVGEALDHVRRLGCPVVAVDVPSGVDGDSGQVRGQALAAADTVTFFRLKPGHLLYPGRALCGSVTCADIGIPERVLDEIAPKTAENLPGLWRHLFPGLPETGAPATGHKAASPRKTGHKYDRGHALIVSGPRLRTGAARLSAQGALRVGAGLVTIAGTADALAEHAAHVSAIMLREAGTANDLAALLDDPRFTAALAGPALGLTTNGRAAVEVLLRSSAAIVLDADALTLFADRPDDLFDRIAARAEKTGGADGAVILTPHEGEFARLFGRGEAADPPASKLDRARAAARRSRAVIVLKGADSVIADPDGRAAINTNAPPTLATAGSGDVLAGLCGGLAAAGMPVFEAACAAVWLHGVAARDFGPGLTADDLPGLIPGALGTVLS